MSHSFGSFEFFECNKLGSGQFGCVYRGIRKATTGIEPVAVKKLNSYGNERTWQMEINVLKEISLIDQQNLVRLFDYAIEDDTTIYLFTEFCNGGDLDKYLRQVQGLEDHVMCHFSRQIAEGMKTLHKLNIVHRDLKPQNILLHHRGGGICMPPMEIILKIADFGFSRFMSTEQMTTSYKGSPSYMAPEIFLHESSYTSLCDIFSVGVILYFCRFNKFPFPAVDEAQLKTFYTTPPCKDGVPIHPSFPELMDSRLRDLITRMLRLSPDRRIGFDEWFSHPFVTEPIPVTTESHKVSHFVQKQSVEQKYRMEFEGDGLCEYSRDDGFAVLEPAMSPMIKDQSLSTSHVPETKKSVSFVSQLFYIPSASSFIDMYNTKQSGTRLSGLEQMTPPRHLRHVASPVVRNISLSDPMAASLESLRMPLVMDSMLKYSFPNLFDQDMVMEVCGSKRNTIMPDAERKCFNQIMHYITVLATHREAVKTLVSQITDSNRDDLSANLVSVVGRTEVILRRFYLNVSANINANINSSGVWKKAIKLAGDITQDIVDMSLEYIQFIPSNHAKIADEFLYKFGCGECVTGCLRYVDNQIKESHSYFVRAWNILFSISEGAESEADKSEYRDGIEMIVNFIDFMVFKDSSGIFDIL